MSNDKYDAETKQQIGRAQALEAMFGSAGWQFAEQDLFDLVAELKDISTIDLDSDATQQIRDRKNLAEGLLEWHASLKSQINNAIIMEEVESTTYIERR